MAAKSPRDEAFSAALRQRGCAFDWAARACAGYACRTELSVLPGGVVDANGEARCGSDEERQAWRFGFDYPERYERELRALQEEGS